MITIDPVVSLAWRLAVAGLFAATALHKLRDFGALRDTIRAYELAPAAAIPIAITITALETVAAGTLILPGWSATGATIAVALLATYSAAIAINLRRGRHHLDCGCLGPNHRQPISEWLLARNAALIILTLAVLLPVSARSMTAIDALTVSGFVVFAATAWNAANQLLGTWPKLRRLREVRS